MKKILALIPAYNEEKHLGVVLRDVKKRITDILGVDDGVKDRTAEKGSP